MSQLGDSPDGDNIILFPRSPRSERTGAESGDTPGDRLHAALESCLESFEHDLDRADREAVEVESVFIRRFGFDAPRHQRARLLELKYEADLTDREIRWLKRTGSLVFSATEAKISAPWWFALFGWVQIVTLAVLMLHAFLLATSGPDPTALHATSVNDPTAVQMLKLAVVLAVLGGFQWASYRTYVLPRMILKRVEALRRMHNACPQQEKDTP